MIQVFGNLKPRTSGTMDNTKSGNAMIYFFKQLYLNF